MRCKHTYWVFTINKHHNFILFIFLYRHRFVIILKLYLWCKWSRIDMWNIEIRHYDNISELSKIDATFNLGACRHKIYRAVIWTKPINNRDQQWTKDKRVAYMCLRAASGVIDTHPDPQWGTDSDRGRESLLGLPAAVGKNYPWCNAGACTCICNSLNYSNQYKNI